MLAAEVMSITDCAFTHVRHLHLHKKEVAIFLQHVVHYVGQLKFYPDITAGMGKIRDQVVDLARKQEAGSAGCKGPKSQDMLLKSTFEEQSDCSL